MLATSKPKGYDRLIATRHITSKNLLLTSFLEKATTPDHLFFLGNVDNGASLGKAAWQRRKNIGWTQKQLAEKSCVGVRFISEFESGKSTAKITDIFQLLDALDLQFLNHWHNTEQNKLSLFH
ncbi:helix-turn-helix domain-containing protein [Desulfobaculum bizertense]|uniref:helix-turn-helix domain-containing protein n=1 Tax=Desulfobaculum bizertense TaxID=376490 RepID=UPI00190ECC77|nr:helix-turn-helix domain-containing protein [Desulfobaculum bizertense]